MGTFIPDGGRYSAVQFTCTCGDEVRPNTRVDLLAWPVAGWMTNLSPLILTPWGLDSVSVAQPGTDMTVGKHYYIIPNDTLDHLDLVEVHRAYHALQD